MALLLNIGAVCTAKHRKNSKPDLYNQFLFCNSFLLFVRYLHGGRRTPSELGILSFELGVVLGFACDFELFRNVQGYFDPKLGLD